MAADTVSKTNRRRGPQSPHLKINIRKIQDAEKYGTAEALVPLIQTLLQKVNEKLLLDNQQSSITVDEGSFQSVIENEKIRLLSVSNSESQESAVSMEQPPAVRTTTSSSQSYSIQPNNILVRLLYLIPPKKTNRRGEKPGNVYLVCTTAPVEATLDRDEQAKELTLKRHLLHRFLEHLTHIAAEDAKASQQFAGCQVEEAWNARTWKPYTNNNKKDKYEGTIFETKHYQEFIQKRTKQEEELKARPKPAPGGGLVALTDSAEAPMPVSALVMHLKKKNARKGGGKKKKKQQGQKQDKPTNQDGNKQKGRRGGKGKKGGGGGGSKPQQQQSNQTKG